MLLPVWSLFSAGGRQLSLLRYPPVRDRTAFISLLVRCRELTLASEESIYADSSPAEIVAILDQAITSVEARGPIDTDKLQLLFAPTGALQDTSIDNGWGNEFQAIGTFRPLGWGLTSSCS